MSQRKTILTYLTDTLFPTITTTNGYNFTLGRIARDIESQEQLSGSQYPAVFVAGADEDYANVTKLDFLSDMTVFIIGYVKASDQSVQQQMDNLIEDIQKALGVDLTQGGRVAYTSPRKLTTYQGDSYSHGSFIMEVVFRYKQPWATP